MTGTNDEWLSDEFERQRPHLQAVAYRMLGSRSEAEDAVQESWLRLSRTDAAALSSLRAWLTTVVGRVCLDMLRARRARREEPAGSWLPEPIVSLDGGTDPEHEALLGDAVGLSLLVVLEQLPPAERLAFVLHDMFGVPFDEIATTLDRSPAAARQLASRGRRRVRGSASPAQTDHGRQREVVDAFLAATRDGDLDRLVAVLHPDAVLRIDRGPARRRRPAPAEVRGAREIARQVLSGGPRLARFCRPAAVNGAPGLVVMPKARPIAVLGFAIADGRIVGIDVVVDRAKLPASLG